MSVKTSWAQKCRVNGVETIRGSDDYDIIALVPCESIQLSQQLIERMNILFVSSGNRGVVSSPQRVELIDEHNAWGEVSGLGEKAADSSRAFSNECFDKFTACD